MWGELPGGCDEPDTERLEADGVVLTRDHACFRGLTWNVALAAPVEDWSALRARCLAAGWLDESRLPSLWDLGLPDGHRLLVVPATGRLTLRLHYLSCQTDRPHLALRWGQAVKGLVSR